MEKVLEKLLVADNAIIKQGTIELRDAFKNPECIGLLVAVVVESPKPQIRQYAAVLMRKRLSKGKHWAKLSPEVKASFKDAMLKRLLNEQETSVRKSIAQLIGTVIKHELGNNGWPEVLQFVQQSVTSENLADKEIGMYTLSTMTEVAPQAYLPHAQSVVFLLENTLNGLQDLGHPVAFYVLLTLTHLVPLVEGNQPMVNSYHQMMPRIISVIQALAVTNEEQAVEAFELLDELCEQAMDVISPHVKALVSLCLTLGANKTLDDALRVKAVGFMGWLAKTKKKAFVKHRLVEPVIDMLFNLMAEPPTDESDEAYFCDNVDDSTPMTCATQTLDLLALHLPPEKLIPYVLQHIEPGLQGSNMYSKKASYLAMAVLAEGCSEFIRSKYLESFLRCICGGITSTEPVVRNAALFALGQFAEHLQPEISQYASELLPVLFEYLGHVCSHMQLQNNSKSPPVDRMFYALEVFCENLNEGLLPYLPILMECLFKALQTPNADIHVRELALSAIGAAANASKENMIPYFQTIVENLRGYLTEKQSTETMCLQIQAVDTLGVLARTIGDDHFRPLAEESLNLGMKLMTENDDPDLKKCVYGLFASISSVLKQGLGAVLPRIVEPMIHSIQSAEGIVPHFKDDENTAFPVYEDASETEEEEDIENTDNEDDYDDLAGYVVENSYVEEKEEAILALKEIAKNTGEAYLPYLERSFEEIFKLINYPQEDIRKAAIEALLQFCISFSKINTNEGKVATQKALSVFVPKLAELIRLDEECIIAIAALDAYSELLKELKSDVLIQDGHKDAIINCITEVMTGKTECQDQDETDGDETEAEQDELLIECAGDVLPSFGKAMKPEDFLLYFQALLPLFLAKLQKNKTEAQRSFGIGTISECLSALGPTVANFVPQLLPRLLKLSTDPNAEVRNNAIYGIGELALHGKEAVYPRYPEILQTLSEAIGTETHGGTRDNIVGAIARLIITNPTIVPLEQVFPVFVGQLPLREDFEENKAVFKSVMVLYENGHDVIKNHIPSLLKVAVSIVHEGRAMDDECKEIVTKFLRVTQADFPTQWNELLASLPPEVRAGFQ
ncbi:importin-4-like isoform X1 [Neodiprion fabricii]|uniref:importin-4-like isoform X1 n=1 Tax=Neodiprion fabricii TaxID=2872261 RepID=UPI001ED95B8A|nr:importin-4-like isoform X1 [Neodiprion fabricii]